MVFNMNDTIAAISTAPGEGGIGIVRISGDLSGNILNKIFKKSYGSSYSNYKIKTSGKNRTPVHLNMIAGAPISVDTVDLNFENKRMYHGYIYDNYGNTIDEVLSVFMKGPKSYTGEDVAEIHCHGSIIALRRILDLVLSEGAVPAEPGEFTKRAFLNGRIDLSQAESVIDIIKAKTEVAHQSAIQQMDGSLSVEVKRIRTNILDLLSSIAVELDYPEEDVQYLNDEDVVLCLSQIGDKLDNLRKSFDIGRILSQGLKTVIIGKPNVGKSSLFNALLAQSRAIITDIPGTTRDTIEEDLNINGLLVRLIDTAGIRHTDDEIEKLGVLRSSEALKTADLILLVVDGSNPLEYDDRRIIDTIPNRPLVALINKEDLGIKIEIDEISSMLSKGIIIKTSIKTGAGIDELKKAIEDMVFKGKVVGESLIITNSRHKQLLDKAAFEIDEVINLAKTGGTIELVDIYLKQAYDYMGEIIGESVSDDVIKEVFSRFCLGK